MYVSGRRVDEVELGGQPVTIRFGDRLDGPEITFELLDAVPRPRPPREEWSESAATDGYPPVDPVALTVDELVVTVPDQDTSLAKRLRAPFAARGGKPSKTLLGEISFAVEPGQMVAIIGPSGAGKSTLLKALIGQVAADGAISYNGQHLTAWSVGGLRSALGYVPQEDILHADLTLGQALDYCAKLRLPDEHPAGRYAAISHVLRQLGLGDKRDAPIRRLSGGERKRASVAPELLTRAPVLFLDEPTTGLDPDAERLLVRRLRSLANEGSHTVVMITHSPAVLALCDRVLVIGKDDKDVGRLACYGSPGEVLNFFGVGDFASVYERVNEADFEWSVFRTSDLYRRTVSEPVARTAAMVEPTSGKRWTTPVKQVPLLARRNLAVIMGNARYTKLLAAQAPLMAALLYLVLGGGNLTKGRDADPRPLLAFVVIGALAIGLVNSCREIVKELPIYLRERTVGLSLRAYLTSKVCCLGALSVVQSGVLALVLAGQGGPTRGALLSGRLTETWLVLFASTLAATAAGLFISAVVTSDATALVMVPIVLVGQLLVTGAFLEVEGRPLLAQAAYASPAYWSFNGLAASNDLVRVEDRCFTKPEPATLSCSTRWRRSPGNVAASLTMMFALTAAYTAAAATALRRKDPLSSR